ncbi:glycoside hydrolase family 88 protein [Alteromonas aestuariivivens]|uniref:Glycoside hydrolase family 88 protein n=1 Tax=Alteromonas aestuariivivens TaxID=1938339 RepID=A0A3D8MEH6_9ALTE|nr:glycoside hydrolase family 88 protein [Alteromonas aestuariivivens]RDV29152.1 glycoside hydrolase family 88 protein [Alteromonas aestuariivivens]
MSRLKSKLGRLALALMVAGVAGKAQCQQDAQPQYQVEKIANQVADWQLQHLDNFDYIPSFHKQTYNTWGWVHAAFYVGLNRWADTTQNGALYRDILHWADDTNHFLLGPRAYHADDYAVGQVYTDLYLSGRAGEQAILASKNLLTHIAEAKPNVDLAFNSDALGEQELRLCQLRWCWSDALFMASAVWIDIAHITGNDEIFEFFNHEFWAATDYLFNEKTGFYFRDSRFIGKKGDFGEDVHWGRGNGWVFAAMVDILEGLDGLPNNHKDKYEALFKRMAKGLVKTQREDGFWAASLMAPEQTSKELSGTAFFLYGLVWGVDNGLLDAATYNPIIDKAWQAMKNSVRDDGSLTWVQQIGFGPESVVEDSTQLYGTGAVLLAASELYKRCQSQPANNQLDYCSAPD